MSTALASLEFGPIDDSRRLAHVEHSVFFDKLWATDQAPRGA